MLKLHPQVFHLANAHLLEMSQHLSGCLPEEGCGLISGNTTVEGWHGRIIYPVTNVLHSPVRFRMAPQEQLAVFQAIEKAQESLVGIFHSHPVGPPGPSETDLQEFAYPDVPYLISHLDNGLWRVRAFLLNDGRVSEIRVQQSPHEIDRAYRC